MKILPDVVRPALPRQARHAGDDYGATADPSWRAIDWRRQLRRTQIAGHAVNYVEIGDGGRDPAVFVHGLGGCWQNWLETLPRVGRGRRAIAVDLPGFGGSELAAEPSIPALGRFIDDLCEQLDLGRVALIGNSLGGFVAAETATQFPQRVERLALVAPAGVSRSHLERQPIAVTVRISRAITAHSASAHRQVAARPRLRHLALQFVTRHPSRLDPDLVYEGLMRGAGKPGFAPTLSALMGYDFRERLGEIRCPTLILWGEKDAILPIADASEFERLIAEARTTVMGDTGHMPMIERPETFNRCLVEFLDADVQARRAAAVP